MPVARKVLPCHRNCLTRTGQTRTIDLMLDKDMARLSEPYPTPLRPEIPPLHRIGDPLGISLVRPCDLGDEIIADLDPAAYGIGWWRAYTAIDRQSRILLSDYLAACARAVADNLVEAQVERLELDHALDDFRQWMNRGIGDGERDTVEAPISPYEDLASYRLNGHLAGVLRAWGSALDCLGGCIVGVAGLEENLVKAALQSALARLDKQKTGSKVLERLHADLEQAEASAGPPGWRPWLLGMRHTAVHRGRRTGTFQSVLQGGKVTEFNLRLPVQADLTDIEAIVQAQGVLAATFDSPATAVLDQLGQTVASYISDACSILIALWRDRRADPSLLAQSPKQWKQPASRIVPAAFQGFPGLASPPTKVTSLGVSPEGERRYLSAGIRPGVGDVRPDPSVWT